MQQNTVFRRIKDFLCRLYDENVIYWQRFIKKNKITMTEQESEEQQSYQKALLKNPYLQSKALWNEVHGDLNSRYQRSQRLNFILTGIVAFSIVSLIVVAGETKIRSVPFIVHGNEVFTLSNPINGDMKPLQSQLAPYFSKQFIMASRSISADRDVNREHQVTAYALAANESVQVLNDFYEKHHVNQIARQTVKEIAITSVLSTSPHTFDVRWKEQWRNAHTGILVNVVHYIGQLNYRYRTPSQNETILQHNPLGFYITHLSWSIDQNHE